MTDQLDGRDLDRACAEAMGWTTKEFSSATAMVRGKELVWQPPRYSTDPSTQKEKLAWLRQHHQCIALFCDPTEVLAGVWEDGAVLEELAVVCTTTEEALARLVCSVAKAKKEQGK